MTSKLIRTDKAFLLLYFPKIGNQQVIISICGYLPNIAKQSCTLILKPLTTDFRHVYFIFPNDLLINRRFWFSGFILGIYQISPPNNSILRGEKLNYKSVAKEISKPFFNSWSPVGIKVYCVCSIHVSFKCFEPRPYLVCHVTTIENV